MAESSQMNPAAKRRIPLDQQSIVLEGEERIHVSCQCDYQNNEYTISKLYDDVSTLYEGFLRGEMVSNDGPCLGWRPSGSDPYNWMSYSEVRKKAQFFGSALIEKGFEPSNESKIGIFCQNRPEWVIADLGLMTFSMVTVPLYSTLGPDGYNYIIEITSMKLIVVDTLDKANALLQQIEKIPSLKHIVVMETPITDEISSRADEAGVEMIVYEDLLEFGEKNVKEPSPCKPDELAVIRYTSGTTGVPKGALLTHGNIIANVSALYSAINPVNSCVPGTISVSYLPLAHAYEHTLQAMLFQHGCTVGFFRGDVKQLVGDMQALMPDIFPCVPRLANKIYDKIIGGVNSASFIKRNLFNWAYSFKLKDVQRGIVRKDTWSDTIVFRKLQAMLGGNVKWMITGSAPIADEVLEFFRVVFGCPISEAYGQTEATAAVTCCVPGETESGHVGAPLSCNMVKLVDVPEMGYFASEDKGEVCFKGPNVFMGYYKNPEKTAEAMDVDGWLHSGDIGLWQPNGTLKLVDRKKHIYKLAQGEYVAPEKIENIITRSTLIAQAFVHGESLKSFNVAIIVPDEDELKRFATNNRLEGPTEELLQNETLRSAIRSDLDKMSKAANLCGFEMIREFSLYPEPFSIENGLLTPTFKNKRPAILKHFREQIDALYADKD